MLREYRSETEYVQHGLKRLFSFYRHRYAGVLCACPSARPHPAIGLLCGRLRPMSLLMRAHTNTRAHPQTTHSPPVSEDGVIDILLNIMMDHVQDVQIQIAAR